MPSTRMPTVNVLRIMKLRSASATSWLVCVGNQGDSTINTPSAMPHQSSHVRWVPKSRKSDIVDLLLKKAYVCGRRAPHSDAQATGPAASGRMLHQNVGTNSVLARETGNNLASRSKRNDRRDDMIATVNN